MEQGGSWFQTQLTDFCAHLPTVQHVDNLVDDDDNDDNDNIMEGLPVNKTLFSKKFHLTKIFVATRTPSSATNVPIIVDLLGKARQGDRGVLGFMFHSQAGSTEQSSQLGSTVDSARLHSAQCTVPGSILVHRQAPLSQYQCSAPSYLGHSLTSMLHSPQCTVHSTEYTVHSTEHTVHSTQHTVHSAQYIVHSTQCIVHSSQLHTLTRQRSPVHSPPPMVTVHSLRSNAVHYIHSLYLCNGTTANKASLVTEYESKFLQFS